MLDDLTNSSPFHQSQVKQELTELASSGTRDLPQVTLDFGDDGIRFKPNKNDTKNERLELHFVSKHGKKSELFDPAQAAKDLMLQARLAIDEPEGSKDSLDKLQLKFSELFGQSDEFQRDVVSQLGGRFGGLLSDRPKDEQPLPIASVQIGDGKLTGISFKASGFDDSRKHNKLVLEWNRDEGKAK